MTDLKGIRGFRVRTLDTDSIVGTPPTGAWASGGDLNDNKPYGFGCGGVQTAAIAYGGGLANDTTNENYNGTSWTENSAMNNGYSYATGTGSQTDAIAINGLTTPPFSVKNTTEEWNGSSWTAGGNTNTARYNVANQTLGPGSAAAFIGGRAPDYQPKTFHEQYNGSSWTETTDTPTDIFDGASSGVQTNAILASGNHTKQPPGSSTFDGKTITWDGSSWTEVTEFSTARTNGMGTGVYNDFLYIGGYNPSSGHLALTEKWNGTSWTEIADMGTGKNSLGGGKTESDSTSSIVFGGSPGPSGAPTQTEEFSIAPSTATIQNVGQVYFNSTSNSFRITNQSIPNGTWSSGGSMNTGRQDQASFGSQNASLAVSGNSPSTVNVENYDGSSWTEIANVNTGREFFSGGGKTTAGMVYSGTAPSVPERTVNVEDWDGSSWTEIANVNTGRYGAGGTKTGTPTSQIMFCGNRAPNNNSGYTETWNGTSWTEVGDANTARRLCAGVGSSTSDAFVFGGDTNPNPYTVNAETWDGSSWTEVGNLNTAVRLMGSAGITTSALCIGGDDPSADTAKNEFWNGSSWTELADLASAKSNNSGSGSTFAGLSIGGPPSLTTTEEWTSLTQNQTITIG